MMTRAEIDQAACSGADPDLFFPSHGVTPVTAIRLCGGCPVREACLAEALSRDPVADRGVWGGTTERERIRMRSRLGVAA
jgi:WhiB family redox-sensing transcriptional regulator